MESTRNLLKVVGGISIGLLVTLQCTGVVNMENLFKSSKLRSNNVHRKLSQHDNRVKVILYDTTTSVGSVDTADAARLSYYLCQLSKNGIEYALVGSGEEWGGWGSKAHSVMRALDGEDDNKLIIVSDARDVLLNPVEGAVDQIIEKFNLAAGGVQDAVVVGAEGQCCVAALSHANPGDYFNADGSRGERACFSGDRSCLHRGTRYQTSWEEFMTSLAADRGFIGTQFPYLNAGLLAGKAKDVKRMYNLMDLKATEDDQAVMTDLMYLRPDWMLLDYSQQLFGSNSWTLGADVGCLYEWDGNALFNTAVAESMPLFIHFPNKFFECYNKVARHLESVPEEALTFDLTQGCNYQYNYGNYGNYGNYDNYDNQYGPYNYNPYCHYNYAVADASA